MIQLEHLLQPSFPKIIAMDRAGEPASWDFLKKPELYFQMLVELELYFQMLVEPELESSKFLAAPALIQL